MNLQCCNEFFVFVQSLSHVWPYKPHGLQHARLPCPSLSPGVCLNSCPSSRWCHPTISSSCGPLLLLLSIFPSIRVFSSEAALHQVAKLYPFDPSLLQSLCIYYFPDLNHSSLLDNSDSFTFLFKYHFTGKLPLAFMTRSSPLSPSNLHISFTAILKLLSYIYLFCYIVSLTSFSHVFIKAWICLIFSPYCIQTNSIVSGT